MTPAGERAVTLGAALLGAGIALAAASVSWVAVAAPADPLVAAAPVQQPAEQDVARALALAALAGGAATLLARGAGRRIMCGLLALAGIGVVAAVAVALGSAGSAAVATSARTAWALLAGCGGLLLALAGATGVLRAGRWPKPSVRHDPVERGGDDTPPAAPGADERRLWEALDRGEDPTTR